MSIIDEEERKYRHKKHDNVLSQELRVQVKSGTKDLKTQWVKVGQILFGIWRDKTYEYWGHEKFDHYTEKELGIKKALAMKMVKAYIFLEDWEPHTLKQGFFDRDPEKLPDLDAISVLRSARQHKEITREEYVKLRYMVLEKADQAADVRRAMKAMLAEKDDEEEENVEAKKVAVLRKFKTALLVFKSEVRSLKGFQEGLIKKADDLFHEFAELI